MCKEKRSQSTQEKRRKYRTIAETILEKEKQLEELVNLRKEEIYSALKIGGAADVDTRLLAGFARYVATSNIEEDAIVAKMKEKAKELDALPSKGKQRA